MAQEKRNQDMVRMLGVLGTGFRLMGRAFRTFEAANNRLVAQYTLTDSVLPVCPYSSLSNVTLRANVRKGSNTYGTSPGNLRRL